MRRASEGAISVPPCASASAGALNAMPTSSSRYCHRKTDELNGLDKPRPRSVEGLDGPWTRTQACVETSPSDDVERRRRPTPSTYWPLLSVAPARIAAPAPATIIQAVGLPPQSMLTSVFDVMFALKRN